MNTVQVTGNAVLSIPARRGSETLCICVGWTAVHVYPKAPGLSGHFMNGLFMYTEFFLQTACPPSSSQIESVVFG